MSKSLGNIVVPWDVIDRHGADAFRWYFLTTKLPWDGYLFNADTVGESLRQFLLQLWNTYGFYVLYANVNGVEPSDARAGQRPRPLGAVAAGRDGRDGHRAAGRLRRHARRPGDRGVRRRPLELVRAPLAPPLLGRRPGRVRDAAHLPGHGDAAARAVHAVHRRRDLRQPRRRRAERPSDATGPRPASATTRPRVRDGDRRARPSGSASPRAARPSSRSASRCAPPWSSPPAPSATRSSASPTSRSTSSTSRSCATSRRPTSSAPTRSSPTTARSARASASRCRRSRPPSPRSTRPRRRRAARRRPRRRSPSTATTTSSAPTT